MFLFKTSGETFDSVIHHQKHAFRGRAKDWSLGELVLVSKNRDALRATERQIQYVMRLRNWRPLRPGEAGRYWPGTEGRWEYLVECDGTARINHPFDLDEVLGDEAAAHKPVMTFTKFSPAHEQQLSQHLNRVGVTPVR
jgi:hypothetical protein